MARTSRSSGTYSSEPCYISRQSSRTQSSSEVCYTSRQSSKRLSSKTSYTSVNKSNSDVLASSKKFKFGETVKIMYNDVRQHLSQFISCVGSQYFDVPQHRKKGGDVSEPRFSYDVHDHRKKAGNVSKRISSDVHDDRKKTRDVSKPNFCYDGHDHQDKVGHKSEASFSYQCYPLSHINKGHCEEGNKIIMPAAAMDAIISMKNIDYPVAFKIINPLLHKFSHCGVLEFSGKENNVYLPNWMMNSLLLQQGQVVNIEYVALPKGTFLKVQPHSTKFFMNLSDPKEAMERILKEFASVTVGDTIMVNHENQSYRLNIVQARPKKAVSLIETDCELEFTKALDHKESEKIKPKDEDVTSLDKDAERLDEDDDEKKMVVTLRKYSRTPFCNFDDYSAKIQRQSTLKMSRRR